jgi:hypothetical protein
MPVRKAFLLRIDPALLDALQRWADDDLRSLNGQLEYLLRKALRQSGRDRTEQQKAAGGTQTGASSPARDSDA